MCTCAAAQNVTPSEPNELQLATNINVLVQAAPQPARGPAGKAGPPGPPGSAPSVSIVNNIPQTAPKDDGDSKVGSLLAAVAAALVAGLFGLVGLVISKENKTSEFRQAWIDSLRSDIADFVASGKTFIYYDMARKRAIDHGGSLEYQKILRDLYDKALHARVRIRLRLNPDDSDPEMREINRRVLDKISKIGVELNNNRYDEASKLYNSIHKDAGPLLKAEWERVKRGEPGFRVAKWAAAIIATVSAIAVIVLVA